MVVRKVNIRKKDAKIILKNISSTIKLKLAKSLKETLVIRLNNLNVLIVDKAPLIVFKEDFSLYYPFVESTSFFECPFIEVDRGAVPFILRGADVMVPGIKCCQNFQKGEIVFIRGERINRVIAIGQALVSSSQIKVMRKGKAVKNLHYVGDKIWKVVKKELF